MTWAEYKEIIKNTAYSSDLEYKIHYAWIHGEKTFRADRLLSPETTIINIPAYISGDNGRRYPINAISKELFSGNKAIRDIILPSGISDIPAYAFSGCSNLERIFLPKSLRYIRESAFKGCETLKDVYYAGSQTDLNKMIEAWFTHQIEFGPLIPGTPVHTVLDDSIRVSGNEAIIAAVWHINCNMEFNEQEK